ncbi:MAG: CBS domain-containing protein [Halobacteriaceae archaeon]
MNVGAIMSTPVVTVGPAATLRDAVDEMLAYRIGSVVVGDGGPLGILTRSDVLRAVAHDERSIDTVTVGGAMTEDVVTTSADTSVKAALRAMEAHDVKKLPVTDGVELAGIVTLTDVGRHLPERVAETRRVVERRDDWTDD